MSNIEGISLESIVNSSVTWELNRQLALKLSLTPRFYIGEFFEKLSDAELESAHEKIAASTYDEAAQSELFLMTLLLSEADGLPANDDALPARYEAMNMCFVMESLSRGGVVTIDRQKQSISEEKSFRDFIVATEEGQVLIAQLLGEQ